MATWLFVLFHAASFFFWILKLHWWKKNKKHQGHSKKKTQRFTTKPLWSKPRLPGKGPRALQHWYTPGALKFAYFKDKIWKNGLWNTGVAQNFEDMQIRLETSRTESLTRNHLQDRLTVRPRSQAGLHKQQQQLAEAQTWPTKQKFRSALRRTVTYRHNIYRILVESRNLSGFSSQILKHSWHLEVQATSSIHTACIWNCSILFPKYNTRHRLHWILTFRASSL